ncbi:hypothetical protein Q8F55_009110 [Vanrija albida]|uniref:CCHC-type domain-containing protein n=1 Tax=Vanrija albida TaxID=181172 RepID=A0ABR3PSQ0_9TREE
MARFTNIGMPRKTFVASAAEEKAEKADHVEPEAPEAGPSEGGKRKGWGRDPEIAKRARNADMKTEQRRLQRIDERAQATTCFACRAVGHTARECPNILLAASGQNGSAAMLEADKMAERQAEAGGAEESGKKKGKKGKGKEVTGRDLTSGKCYRCNSEKHSLSHCRKPVDAKNPTPYATCFVCLETGHLSAACPKNKKGVYVNGGSCKVCGSVAHRANDCPDDKREKPAPERFHANTYLGTGAGAGADEDDFMVNHRQFRAPAGQKGRHEAAKNSQRGPAKQPGEEGAFAPAAAAPVAKAKPKPKKVVTF